MPQPLARRRRNYLRYSHLLDGEARARLHRQKHHAHYRRHLAQVSNGSLEKRTVGWETGPRYVLD